MPEIGATLREARMRERIDVSEIEAKTKIRAKYLRALENEEWDLLPGPTFVKSFLRTYAQALGLDDKALLEEYKLSYEHPRDAPESIQQAGGAAARRQRARGGGGAPRRNARASAPSLSRGYLVAVGVVGVLIVLLIIGLLSNGGGSSGPAASTGARKPAGTSGARHVDSARHRVRSGARASLASLKLEPTGEVYVCLIGDGERKRIPGLILKPGAAEPEYHARRFLLTLGNDSVTLLVNGRPRTVPPSSGAIGYAITATGVRTLASGDLPTCT
jgi:cytoskeleton protein RodZ